MARCHDEATAQRNLCLWIAEEVSSKEGEADQQSRQGDHPDHQDSGNEEATNHDQQQSEDPIDPQRPQHYPMKGGLSLPFVFHGMESRGGPGWREASKCLVVNSRKGIVK